MIFQRPNTLHIQARTPSSRERVLVVTEDPDFWFALRQEAPDLETAWMLAHTARECLIAVEDARVQVVILDGALNDKPANQLLHLVKQIRENLPILFAFDAPREEGEREARQAGVLFYGDRKRVADIVRVVRETIRRGARTRPRPGEFLSEGGR